MFIQTVAVAWKPGIGETLGMPCPATLILIPTELEKKHLAEAGALEGLAESVALCGFGIAAAAARTAQLVASHSPQRVLLVGIAGTYDEDRLPVGQACFFRSVAVDGIGCGQGPDHLTASAMGFEQWPEQNIADRIELSTPPNVPSSRLLLTCCAASATHEEADLRHRRIPEAIAEDMEGFGVAIACAMAGTPLAIVRGVSNRVGDRDPRNWRIQEALMAADAMIGSCFSTDQPWEKPS